MTVATHGAGTANPSGALDPRCLVGLEFTRGV
jgi:hypothetical protein